MIKLQVRGFTIKYSTRKKKSRNNRLAALEKKLSTWEDQLANGSTIFRNTQQQIQLIKNEIQQIMSYKMQGDAIKCRADWLQGGEKPTSYFLRQEARNFNNGNIARLHAEDGLLTMDQDIILTEEYKFFKKLYKTMNIAFDPNYLIDINMPKILQAQKTEIDRVLDFDEIMLAIKSMTNGKVAGNDGLPVKFYKMFLPKLKSSLYNLYIEIIDLGEMHESSRRGIITLRKKVERDTLFLKNWKPLSLLNVVYKIFTKVLAT